MTIETCAKINLTLEMLRRRPDGFHELATVFQAVDLCDRITLEPAARLEVVVRGAPLPTDQRNLCYRAAELLATHAGRAPRVRIRMDKRIPIGAGLGGGSGNAAGTLAALARWWDLPLTDVELAELGAELGSDVAFFVRGGTAVGRGRGEQLEAIPPLTGYAVLIVAPAEAVSTAAVYRALSGFRPDAGEATQRLVDGLRAGAPPPPAAWLVNDLEAPAARVSAAVQRDRERLAGITAWPWQLSGSGGAWFLLAPGDEVAAAAGALRAIFPDRACWSTRPVDHGWRLVTD